MPRGPQLGVERGQYSQLSSETKQRLIDAMEDGEDYLAVVRPLRSKQPQRDQSYHGTRMESHSKMDEADGEKIQ